MIPEALRHIECRTSFGLQTSEELDAISFLDDNEILIVVGNRICHSICGDVSDSNKKTRYFFPAHPQVASIRFTVISQCKKYIAASVMLLNAENHATAIVYEREPMADLHAKPALFSHEGNLESSLTLPLEFAKLTFSADSTLVAGTTTDPNLGILIYSWRTAEHFHTIPLVDIVMDISFHPVDSSKICTVGSNSLLKFWHFNNRYSNAAPVTGNNGAALPRRDYCSIVWINKTQLVVGSTDGMLTVVKGCNAKQTRRAFRPAEEPVVSVTKIIIKSDMLLACSSGNRVALFELSKSTEVGVVEDVYVTLNFKNRFILSSLTELRGICWMIKSEFSSVLLAASATELSLYEIDKYREEETQPLPLSPLSQIATYHYGSIRNLSISTKSGLFVSSCVDDESVAVWDLGTERSLGLVRERYLDGVGLPVSVDMHPAGRRVIFGCENCYREYAITYDKLEMMSDFPAQAIFNGPKGEAFVNNSSVSKVKYSNNGNYLAIITGRLGQVLNLADFVYKDDITGVPKRVMVIMDHVTTISDICFNPDDSIMYTCSLDGYIYEWSVLSGDRLSEYNVRNIPITRIFCSDTNIFAVLEPALDVMAENKMKKRGTGLLRESKDIRAAAKAAILGRSHATTAQKRNQQLACWKKGGLMYTPSIVELPFTLSSVALGKFQSQEAQDVIVFGTTEREVVVSILPLPIVSLDRRPTIASFIASFSSTEDEPQGSKHFDMLDMSSCQQLLLHNGAVTALSISKNGLWILTGGADGTINVLGTSRKFPAAKAIPDANTTESRVILMNIAKIRREAAAVAEMEARIHDTVSKKDREMAILRATSQRQISDLETKLKREVEKRDNIIVSERNEYIRKNKEHVKEVQDLQDRRDKDLTILEVGYEKKLAKESEYLQQMQQAYDEFVVHARLDLADSNEKWRRRIAEIDEQSISQDSVMDRNKALLMMYCEYVSSRYEEVITKLEQSYEDKLSEAELKLRNLTKSADVVQSENKSNIMKMAREVRVLQEDVALRESELAKVKGELDWSREKVSRLEEALQSSTVEISRRAEECSRWEYKAGEQQQHLSELEKIRKALISQLHLIRQELRPKDEKLAVISQDLVDGEREYASALEALSEKKREMSFHEEKLHLLQKQNRDLRSRLFAKETTLSRAASLFTEYKHALQQAFFDRRKVTVGDFNWGKINSSDSISEGVVQNGMVELIARNKGMEAALGRLETILSVHGTDDNQSIDVDEDENNHAIVQEQKRQMSMMQKTVQALQDNVEQTQEAAASKVHSHIHDNRILLEEMNSLRQKVKSLTRDKQQLVSRLDMSQRSAARSIPSDYAILPSTLVSTSIQDKELFPTPATGNRSFEGGINLSAKDKIDAIFHENEKHILDKLSQTGSVSNTMLDILQMHISEIQTPSGDVKSISKHRGTSKTPNTRPKKLGFGLGSSQHRDANPEKVELVLDIRSSKGTPQGTTKFPKVKSSGSVGVSR